MRLPTSLDDWTFEAIQERAASRDGEPQQFDWKEVLVSKAPAHKPRLCRVASSMANTGGGFLIFGVKDTAPTLDERLVGIPLNGEERHDFGQAVGTIVPPLQYDGKVIPHREGRGFFVVHVPESVTRPHMCQYDKDDYRFYRRDERGGTVNMNYYEVRDQMMISEGIRRKSRLFRLELRGFSTLSDALLSTGNVLDTVGRFDVPTYKQLLAEVCVVLPSDSVIDALYGLSQRARLINQAIDNVPNLPKTVEIGTGRYPSHARQRDYIIDELRMLRDECKRAEAEILPLIGPLWSQDDAP